MDTTTRSHRRAWETASEKRIREYDELLAEADAGTSLLGTERDLLRAVLSTAPDVVHWQSGNGTDDIARLLRPDAFSLLAHRP